MLPWRKWKNYDSTTVDIKNKFGKDENVSFCVKPGEKLTSLSDQSIDSE